MKEVLSYGAKPSHARKQGMEQGMLVETGGPLWGDWCGGIVEDAEGVCGL